MPHETQVYEAWVPCNVLLKLIKLKYHVRFLEPNIKTWTQKIRHGMNPKEENEHKKNSTTQF